MPLQPKPLHAALFSAWILVSSTCASAQGAADQSGAVLRLITETARDICADLPLTASDSRITLTADAAAKLSGAVKKLADLGVSGAATYTKGESVRALLEGDVLPAMKDTNSCRLKVFEKLEQKLLRPTPEKQACTYEERAAGKKLLVRQEHISQVEVKVPPSQCYRTVDMSLQGFAKAAPAHINGVKRSKFVVEANGEIVCTAEGEYDMNNALEFTSEFKQCVYEVPLGVGVTLRARNASPSTVWSTRVNFFATILAR